MHNIKLSIWLAWKFFKGQKKGYNRFTNFVTLITLALGIAILITVTSVMDGFEHNYRQRLFNTSTHFTIKNTNGQISDYQVILNKLQKIPTITQATATLTTTALMKNQDKFTPVMATGTSTTNLQPNHAAIDQDNISTPSQKIILIFPRLTQSMLGLKPIIKSFTPTPTSQEQHTVTINLTELQKIMKTGPKVDYIAINIQQEADADNAYQAISKILPQNYYISSWHQQYQDFFHALATERAMMTLVLSLIIFIAAFNLISGLIGLVEQKRKGIAILLTIGLEPTNIGIIFLFVALIITTLGMTLGTVLGLIITHNVNAIVNIIEIIFQTKLFSPNVYFVTNLPTQISYANITLINFIALTLCIIASIYPTLKANRIQPAAAMKHE